MVNVSIFIEGGVLPNENVDVQTIDNSERLREGFYSIFSQMLSPNKFNVSIKLGSGNKQTVKFFISKIHKQPDSILLIDLDDFNSAKHNKLDELGLSNYEKNVFFMVQEMEAWIISQIDKVDLFFRDRFFRKKVDIQLSSDRKIKNNHPEDIVKPSRVLKEIIGRYYSYYQNKKRNKKYSKLKDGADLLSILDSNELQKTFNDFNNLIVRIEQL